VTSPLPPHDLDAEAAVLSAVLLEPERLAELEGLPPEAFFHDRNRWVWTGILGVAESGRPIDAVTVGAWLKEHGRLVDAGGVPYISKVVDDVPSVHNVAAYGAIVLGHWRKRKAVAELEALTAKLKTGAAGLEAVGAAAAKLDALGGAASDGLRLLSGRQLAQPLQRIPWLCRALGIGPGRATILGGYGGVGKTFAAQSLMLAVAAGHRRLWDCYELQHEGGAVLHLDFEQGQWITQWRYQRLAYSLGIDLDSEVGDRITTTHYPALYLTDPTTERRLVKLCTGKAVVLIDSLRAACPGVDENDSAMGSYLYLLARVSELTGATLLVVHHEGKTTGDNPRSGIEKLRGSSAIAAGAGSVLSFVKDGSGAGVVRIEHTRANLGQEAAPELMRLLDEGEIDDNTGKTVGLKLEWVPREQLRQEAVEQSDEALEAEFLALCERMLATIKRHQAKPDGVTGVGQLARLMRIGDHEARRAFAHLKESGAVKSNGRNGKAARWQVAQDGSGDPSEGDFDAEPCGP
jgi:hypothetical protein